MISLSQPSVISKEDGPEAIRQYKQLCDEGIITKEEFERKKKGILFKLHGKK